MNKQPVPQFRFEPRRFRRHDLSGIRNPQKLFYSCWKKGKSNCRFACINQAFKFFCSAQTTNEVDSLVCPYILNAQNRSEQTILKNAYVEMSDCARRQSRIGSK